MKRLCTPPRTLKAGNAGFTLIEVLIAAALVGFSLVVMFGFHSQAVRSNMHARKMTDCTYIAQLQMERLIALPWTSGSRHDHLEDIMSDSTTSSDEWVFLEHPASGAQPTARNSSYDTGNSLGAPVYFVTWDVSDMDSDETGTRLRVRCQYYDGAFDQWKGTTVSSYRFMDNG